MKLNMKEKKITLRLRLPQPSQHSDKAEMADSIDC